MDYNNIHLVVEVYRRAWHLYRTVAPIAIVAVIIGDQAVYGIQIVRFRLSNRLQHQFNQNHTSHAHNAP